MKLNFSKYLAAGFILLGAIGMAGCQDNFDDPTADVPTATLRPNMTIAEFKAEFWQDENNYCVEIPAREDGSHYIVSGRVISSDYDGNIFKCLYIQDETGALPMSINQYNLYTTNRVGQEIVVDLTGMYCGKYNGMFQLGFPEWYEQGQAWETSFMAPELFRNHIEYNGNPQPELVDTILINDFSELSSDVANLQKLQGQLVRFNNATFVNAGVAGNDQLCMTYHSSGENQSLNVCNNGGAINVRTSGYAKFWNTKLPTEACDVVGILSFYGTQGWQLLLNDLEGLMNIGNATSLGSHQQPYSISDVITLSENGTTNAWAKGYIVGSVAPEVTEVTSNDDITWTPPFILDNTLVIAAQPDVRDFTQCVLVPLADGSNLFTIGNLADNPDNLGKWLNLQGRFTRSMGMAAITGNTGKPGTFELEGVPFEDTTIKNGDGSEANPYSVTQTIALGNPGSTAWVKGYIVGVINYDNNSQLETGVPTTVATCIAIADSPDETDKNKCVAVQLPVGDVRTALNLANNPDNLGKVVQLQGTLEKYFGMAGLKNTSAYKLDGEGGGGSVTPPTPPAGGEGDGTEANPYNAAAVIALGNPGSTAWVKGYIIGVINYDNNSQLETGVPTTVATCIAIADSPDETDKNKCVAAQLPIGDVRTALNLVDHPENLGKMVQLQGTLEKYFGIAGLKNTSAYKFDGEGGGGSDDGGGSGTDTPTDGGTKDNPYSVEQANALGATGAEAWVEGHIVGFSTNGTFSAKFTAEGAIAANILLATSADETDPSKVIPVQLSSGTDIRAALNLLDHPENLGKKVKILGKLDSYFSRTGLKSTTEYVIE